jgi:hypothetical protein
MFIGGIEARVSVAILLFPLLAYPADWTVEVVDNAGTGLFSSLKIDHSGSAHLAYVLEDGRRRPLKYAFWDHKLDRWFVMEVEQSAAFSSLALDSNGRPRISFVDAERKPGAKLRYARWAGTAWVVEAIPLSSEIINSYTSIALDAEDRPSICFFERRDETNLQMRLRNAMWNGEYWAVHTIDGQEGSGAFNAMASDGRGTIHLVFASAAAGGSMRYAFWNGRWNVDTIDSPTEMYSGAVGQSVAIALDRNGNPHVAYFNTARGVLKYAVRRDGRWNVQAIDTVSKVADGDRNSIAVDDEGRPYIGYFDSGKGILKVAHRDGNRWVSDVVDENRAGFTSSLQIQGDSLWISYADEANHALKVARTLLRNAESAHSNEASRSNPPGGRAQQ